MALKEEWFGALMDWNLWGNLRIELKEREVKLSLPPRDVILSVMGVRRSGKTRLCYILTKNFHAKDVLVINFEDPRLRGIRSEDIIKIVELYSERVSGKDPKILVLDEVQNVDGWEKTARLYSEARGVNVIVTGSSSKLMSDEYSSVLTGRHIDFELYPLSFREVLMWNGVKYDGIELYRNKAKIMMLLDQYLQYGGFPEINLMSNERDRRMLLSQYFEDMLMKDIVRRYRIREIEKAEKLAHIYLFNISTLQSYNRLKNSVGLSLDSVERFSRFFEIARMFLFVPKYGYSIKQIVLSPRKVYTIDIGLYTARGFKFSENRGRLMENLVAIELMRRRAYWHKEWELYYWKDYQQREVDFVVKEGERIKECIQVTYASGKDEIERREIRALDKASEELRCEKKTVITWDYEEKGEIRYVPLWKWLLERE